MYIRILLTFLKSWKPLSILNNFMKTLLLSVLFSITFFQLSAQCSEQATNFGNNTGTPSYNVSGNISVTLNTNNTVTINFASNYSTASGPDVRLYLIKSKGKTISQLKGINPNKEENISFGLVGFSGAQSYTQNIPDNINISEYDTVFFYCLEFTAFWDLGKYTPLSSANCTVLSTNSPSKNNIKVYPNPVTNKIFISNLDSDNSQIRIFNVLGKLVLQQKNNTQNGISVTHLPKGIYMLQLNVEEKTLTKKIVID